MAPAPLAGGMTARDVAAAYGLSLRQRGARWWACCPLHGEKTASLCFFPDGRYYCFGCHAHGDAADLYAALYGVPLREALRVVKGGQAPQTSAADERRKRAAELRRRVEGWRAQCWAQTCRRRHTAQAMMRRMEHARPPNALSSLDSYWEAVRQAADADDVLLWLESATPSQLLQGFSEACCDEF